MNKHILLTIALCTMAFASAHGAPLPPTDENPQIETCYGDLNKDGIKDKVVMKLPRQKGLMWTDEEGHEYNYNQPVLYIYFGTGKGYKLFKKYAKVLPRVKNSQANFSLDVSITSKGVLRIGYDGICTVPDLYTFNGAFLFRYQKGDFYMIGRSDCFVTNGESVDENFNFSTHRKRTITGHVEGPDIVKDNTTWMDLPKDPLEKLGDKTLEVY